MVRTEPEDRLTVEIAGGPPSALAMIWVAGAIWHRLQLDACGIGRVEMSDANVSGRVEVTVDDQVLLTGHLPAGGGA